MKRSNTDDASTTMSEYSNAPEAMRDYIRSQKNKQGKKIIPKYLKDVCILYSHPNNRTFQTTL